MFNTHPRLHTLALLLTLPLSWIALEYASAQPENRAPGRLTEMLKALGTPAGYRRSLNARTTSEVRTMAAQPGLETDQTLKGVPKAAAQGAALERGQVQGF